MGVAFVMRTPYYDKRRTSMTNVVDVRAAGGELLPEIRLFDLGVRGDLGRGAVQRDDARLQHVGAMAMLQGRVRVLLHEEDGGAAAVHLLDGLEDRAHEERS